MLTRIQLLLIYGIVVLFYAYSEKYVASSSVFVSGVRNLSIKALLQNQTNTESRDAYRFLKLNVSWLPPNSIKQPTSYSIIVTSVQMNGTECPEGTLFYTLKGNKNLSLLVPENNSLVDMPDLYIQPDCSYKVQVIANPRSKNTINVSEIFYTVPTCVGYTCSCTNKTFMLPTPKLNVTLNDGQITVHWNATFNTPDIQFYTISFGIPLLVSRKGLPVYNITRIGQVSAERSMFSWNLKSNERNMQIKDGYKVIVVAVDSHGCTGPEGSFVLNSMLYSSKSVYHHIWFILIAIVISCIFFGALSFTMYRKYVLFIISHNNNPSQVHRISKCKSQWTDMVLQKPNILYVYHESMLDSAEEMEKLDAPFKSVNLIRELGTGQFGKVYLGHLDDMHKTLVAVKMSQQIDMSIDSETRQQFIKEIEIMRTAGHHPHLVSLIGYCIQPNNPICIVLEYMQGGDLLTYLHQSRKKPCNNIIDHDKNNLQDLSKDRVSETLHTSIYSTLMNKKNTYKFRRYANIAENFEETIKINTMDGINMEGTQIGEMSQCQFLKFATEIAMGMEHLELKGITHRDLAARNILLNADLTLKISDFGLSRNGIYVIRNVEEKARHLPIRWMSPEALHTRAFSSKSDVWSFGIVLWEMSTLGAFPYSDVQDDHLLRYIVYENGRLEKPNHVPSDIFKLMLSCWDSNPDNRPNFTELLSTLQNLIASMDNSFWAVSNPCYTLTHSNEITED